MVVLQPGWVPEVSMAGCHHPMPPPGPEAHDQAQNKGVEGDPTWTFNHDLTAEDMLVHYLGWDQGTVRVDRKARPDFDDGMSTLEKEASTLIFDGADSSRLQVLVGFLNLQAKRKLSDVTMTDIFIAIDELIVPKNSNSKMPHSRDEARKIVSDIGLDYHVIHSCPCDCTMYFGKNSKLDSCPSCKRTWYTDSHVRKNVPRKVHIGRMI
jgi:hypothetical protein